MSILMRIIIFVLIIFAGGFCAGMLAWLHIKDRYKAKHRRKLWNR